MAEENPPGIPLPNTVLQQQLQSQQIQQQWVQLFWQKQMQEIEETTDFKNHQLPLARIKKIMKTDEDIKGFNQMIGAEAPLLFAKAAEMFILELTLRAWIHTEESKRRTLQRQDIAAAIMRTDTFDFLIDIVPRDEVRAGKKMVDPTTTVMTPEYQQYILQNYVLQQQAGANASAAAGGAPAAATHTAVGAPGQAEYSAHAQHQLYQAPHQPQTPQPPQQPNQRYNYHPSDNDGSNV